MKKNLKITYRELNKARDACYTAVEGVIAALEAGDRRMFDKAVDNLLIKLEAYEKAKESVNNQKTEKPRRGLNDYLYEAEVTNYTIRQMDRAFMEEKINSLREIRYLKKHDKKLYEIKMEAFLREFKQIMRELKEEAEITLKDNSRKISTKKPRHYSKIRHSKMSKDDLIHIYS